MEKYDINGNLIEGPKPAPPPVVDVISKPKIEAKQLIKFIPIGILVGIFLSISIVAAFKESFFDKPKPQNNQPVILITTPSPQPSTISTPVASDTPFIRFGTPTLAATANPQQYRVITPGSTPEWSTFTSGSGYSFQHHSAFTSQLGEQKTGTSICQVILHNNAGGVLIASVVPYNGTSSSLKDLMDTEESSYRYSYEYARIQNNLALIREKGPTGESGTGSTVVIGKGIYALVITRSNTAKDSEEFTNLLQSIEFTGQLNPSNCGK